MSRAIDPFDELAAMFLSAPQAKAPAMAAAGSNASSRGGVAVRPSVERPPATPLTHEPEIELLIVGHLPVRAGLWLTPYADAIGRQRGATALLRLDSDEPSLQVLRAAGKSEAGTSRPMLKSTLIDLAGEIDCWIVRAPTGTGMDQCAALPVDRITILTSGDEAAVFAAYQIIKDLMQCGEGEEPVGQAKRPRPIPPIGLAVVGVDQQTALGVVERVNRTTVSFLGVEVQLAMCLQRMDPGVKSTQYFTFADQTCPTLAEAVRWLAEVKSLAASLVEPSPIAGKLHADRVDAKVTNAAEVLRDPEHLPGGPEVIVPPMPRIDRPATAAQIVETDQFADDDEQAVEPLPLMPCVAPIKQAGFRPTPPKMSPPSRPVVVIPTAKSVSPSATASFTNIKGLPRMAPPAQSPVAQPGQGAPMQRPVKLSPKPAISYEFKRTSVTQEPVVDGKPALLSSYVEGLIPLAVRSPGHERIELAVDSTGRLHLLGREQTLREMRYVESWAKSHRELIALACPQHPIDQGLKAVCHVFTAEPVALADLHGADLRLHVLAPVQVNGQTAWYAAPLNS